MAKTSENHLTMNYRGKFGDEFVFRMHGDKSVMCKLHDYSKKIWTARQNDNRLNFRKSAIWARNVTKDAKVKRYYKKKAKKGQSAYNMAIGDHMKKFSLKPDFSLYNFIKGGKIKFMMKHVFGASYAEVTVFGIGGGIIKRGPAKVTDKGLGYEFNVSPGGDVMIDYVEITLHRGPATFTIRCKIPMGIP